MNMKSMHWPLFGKYMYMDYVRDIWDIKSLKDVLKCYITCMYWDKILHERQPF